MYVYRTSQFNRELERQSNLQPQVERLCSELATMRLDEVQSRFERVYPYLKRKEGNLRLIARIYRFGKEHILCWLVIFRRGDRKYEEFLREREQFKHSSWSEELQPSKLKQWLKAQKALNQTKQPLPQPLTTELLPWLDRPNWEMDTDGVSIYESESWLSLFQTPEIESRWLVFNQVIAEIADAESFIGEDTIWSDVKLHNKDDCYVLYSKITTSDTPALKVVFLLAPFASDPSRGQIARIVEQIPSPLALRNRQFSAPISIAALFSNLKIDELNPLARRAYPGYLLADETSWLAIEKEETANLALSAEEKAILHSVSTAKASLPLFLNGQAGSGKSTMLFHLFADYCYRHLCHCQEEGKDILSKPHPLFLAYNERLLKVAKERVIPLLESHHRFLARTEELTEIPDLSPFFQTFRSFLRNLLPKEESDRFNDAKYISFHRFRQLYKHNPWEYSPERSWLVIRTFIKGYHLDERDHYRSPEDYLEIPKRERTVPSEEFAAIYDNVWKWYKQRTKEQGEWDDQDLIRRVLQLKSYCPDYTAIFCDEAQDFTQLELQLIMRLSAFSQYDLEHQHIECLPFAFAGDPMQTLNPTGFRWASLKAGFYNEVITALSPTGKLGLEMNFTELESNYRSLPAIVGVNNLIQLWRVILFNIPELKPQKPRKIGQFVPQKYIIGENMLPEAVKYYLQDTIIIVPCDEGGEADYLQKDEHLRYLLGEGNNTEPHWNILSAIAAKGLEFKQVVLYKFGEFCQPEAWESRDHANEEVKYFFNKLYVGASRATERLFIVDTPLGETKLWHKASDPRELEEFLAELKQEKKQQQWREAIQLISLGTRPHEIATDDLESIAQTFVTEGLNTGNPELLRRAQGAYQRLHKPQQAALCEARALKLEKQFLIAGNLFLQQNLVDEAWDCFWQGMIWHKLVAWYESLATGDWERDKETDLPETLQRERNRQQQTSLDNRESYRPLVNFMVAETKNLEAVREFTNFVEAGLKDHSLEKNRFAPQWQQAIQTYIESITGLLKKPEKQIAIPGNRWGEVLEKLAIAGYKNTHQLAGRCFYLAEKLPQAVAVWEAGKITHLKEYNIAKAEVVGLPAGLEFLAKIKPQGGKLILTAWQQAGKPRESPWLQHIAPILEAKQEYANALLVYTWLDNLIKVKSCFTQFWQQTSPNLPRHKPLKILLGYYFHCQYWQEAIAAIETYLPQINDSSFPFTLVEEIANSQLTSEKLTKNQRQRYQKFIQKQILNNPNWLQHLSRENLGIALEKIGSLVETLEFYEKYIQHPDVKLRQFACDRWLATKTNQAKYFLNQGQTNKAKRIDSEIARKAKKWQNQIDSIKLTPATVSRPKKMRKQFKIRNFMIKVAENTQQVLITDTNSAQEFHIDGAAFQIKVGSVILQGQNSPSLSFTEENGSYRGILLKQEEQTILKLNFQGLSRSIIIRMP